MERPPMKAVSECIVEHFKFEWIVKNFSFLKGEKGTMIESSEFHIDINGDSTKWSLLLFPYGNDFEDDVAIYLTLFETNLDDLMVQCKFVLSNSEGEQFASKQFLKPRPYSYGSKRGVHNFIYRDDILTNISSDDNLTIVADFKVSNNVKKCSPSSTSILQSSIIDDLSVIMVSNNVKKCSPSSTSILQSSIIDDLAKLKQDADFSDILITVCGSEFKAHKNILAARSTVFSSMFKHHMKEVNSGRIEIEDMTPKAFEEFLKFIYTGIANVEEYAIELFTAADKYDVQDLKAFCEDSLIRNINEENCLKTLVLSDLHSSTKLKETAINFIVSNTHKTDKNKLAELKNPSLMTELLEALMNHTI